jgi:ACR3 family arsenite efflux pump ArsB
MRLVCMMLPLTGHLNSDVLILCVVPLIVTVCTRVGAVIDARNNWGMTVLHLIATGPPAQVCVLIYTIPILFQHL